MTTNVGAYSYSQLRRHRKEKLEASVKRLSTSHGVYGVLVTTENWTVIDSTFDRYLTHFWRKEMKFVEELGLAAIRDPDPKNDLQFLRLQSKKYEILLSIAKDHRVLVLFSSGVRNPIKGITAVLKQKEKRIREQKRAGQRVRMTLDPCRPHTKMIGGKEKVIITEKISGTLIDQNDDINNI